MYSIIFLAAFVLLVIVSNVRIVSQSNAFVIERLGAYNSTWGTGLHVKLPLLDKIAGRVSLKEQVADFAPQPVITKDNVTMMIDTVIYMQITDPKLYTYGVINPLGAIENLSTTTLRNIIGELELDETLTSRDMINNRMRLVLDEATDPWGIKVNRVEVKNIAPPKSIQEAMEKQMRAERERRESILKAEGEKQSAILVAEGQKASADGLGMIKAISGDDLLVKVKTLEALQKVADGQATKIIIPSDMQNLAGLVTGISEMVKK